MSKSSIQFHDSCLTLVQVITLMSETQWYWRACNNTHISIAEVDEPIYIKTVINEVDKGVSALLIVLYYNDGSGEKKIDVI